MEITNNTLLLILLLGLVLLFVSMNCTFSCGNSEGFFTGFNDQISDPFNVDYAYFPSVANPTNLRWGNTKKHVPVSQATDDYTYSGLSGYTDRPGCDNPYYDNKRGYDNQKGYDNQADSQPSN